MKKQNFFLILALLFACNTIFAQTPGGYPVELKPWNPNNGNIKIPIWNQLGNIKTISTKNQNLDIDVSNLNDGFYVLRVFKNNIFVNTATFIVKK